MPMKGRESLCGAPYHFTPGRSSVTPNPSAANWLRMPDLDDIVIIFPFYLTVAFVLRTLLLPTHHSTYAKSGPALPASKRQFIKCPGALQVPTLLSPAQSKNSPFSHRPSPKTHPSLTGPVQKLSPSCASCGTVQIETNRCDLLKVRSLWMRLPYIILITRNSFAQDSSYPDTIVWQFKQTHQFHAYRPPELRYTLGSWPDNTLGLVFGITRKSSNTKSSACADLSKVVRTFTKRLAVRARVERIAGQGTSLRSPLGNSGQLVSIMVLGQINEGAANLTRGIYMSWCSDVPRWCLMGPSREPGVLWPGYSSLEIFTRKLSAQAVIVTSHTHWACVVRSLGYGDQADPSLVTSRTPKWEYGQSACPRCPRKNSFRRPARGSPWAMHIHAGWLHLLKGRMVG
uniref:Uncharacterized protein n=1 Tax=Timema douglasi TaxID=61478 RepID=A0A7R8Z9U3_TIMDO|nr:unnamed protein product [Timema douglasi]